MKKLTLFSLLSLFLLIGFASADQTGFITIGGNNWTVYVNQTSNIISFTGQNPLEYASAQIEPGNYFSKKINNVWFDGEIGGPVLRINEYFSTYNFYFTQHTNPSPGIYNGILNITGNPNDYILLSRDENTEIETASFVNSPQISDISYFPSGESFHVFHYYFMEYGISGTKTTSKFETTLWRKSDWQTNPNGWKYYIPLSPV